MTGYTIWLAYAQPEQGEPVLIKADIRRDRCQAAVDIEQDRIMDGTSPFVAAWIERG